jgi:membrane-bound ClpP family serine protease
LTDLRPSGTVCLDSGSNIDVVSEGNLIECDTRVAVIDVEGLRVVVRQED